MSKNLSLLKTRRFYPLFAAQALGAINDNILRSTIIIILTFKLPSTAYEAKLWSNLSSAMFILPFFLFSIIGGELSDKFPKSILVKWLKLLEIPITIFAALLLIIHPSPLMLIGMLFIMGLQSAIFQPIKYSALPEYLHRNELLAGNGLVESSVFVGIMLGTILGGFLVEIPQYGIYITSLCMIIIAISGWAISLRMPQQPAADSSLKINLNFLSSTQKAIDSTATQKTIWHLILGISWLWFLGTLYLTQMPYLVSYELLGTSGVYTLFNLVFTLGIGLGSLSCGYLLKDSVNSKYAPFSLLMISVFGIHFYFGTHYHTYESESLITIKDIFTHLYGWRFIIDIFGLSFFSGIFVVPMYAVLQRISKRKYRSRIMACNSVINSIFMVSASILSILFVGGLNIKIEKLFLFANVLNIAFGLYLLRILPFNYSKSIIRKVLTLTYNVDLEGIDNFRKAGKKVVIICNHSSLLDVPILASFLPGRFIFAVDSQVDTWKIFQFIGHLAKRFPMNTSNPFSIKSIIKLINNGERCIIFPEGRIANNGGLMKVYEGAALVALKADAVILPIHIESANLSKVFSRSSCVFKTQFFPSISVKIFPHHTLDTNKVPPNKSDLRKWLFLQTYDLMSYAACNHKKNYHVIDNLYQAKNRHGGSYVIAEDYTFNQLTYSNLLIKSFVLGEALNSSLDNSSNIGLMIPNVLAAPVSFFALLTLRKTPAMINYSSGLNAIASACETAQIKTLVTSSKLIEQLNLYNVVQYLENQGIKIIYLENVKHSIGIKQKLCGLRKYLINSVSKYRHEYFNNANDPAVILFTSGSEGEPKGVVLSHKNLMSNIRQQQSVLNINSKDRIFNALPVFHSFGLNSGMLAPMMAGTCVFLFPNPKKYSEVVETIFHSDSTVLISTNTFLKNYDRRSTNDFNFLEDIYILF